jgi:hypothetical protein
VAGRTQRWGKSYIFCNRTFMIVSITVHYFVIAKGCFKKFVEDYAIVMTPILKVPVLSS